MTGPEFTTEQLYKQAQGNVTAFILGAMAYLKKQGQGPEQLVSFLGNQFSPLWLSLQGQGARVAMEQLVLNFLSGGGHLYSFSGDENKAEAVITDWPPVDMVEFLGMTLEDVEPFFDIFNPIGEALNLDYEWHREGNQITFQFAR
jgi:hypothetical protein